MSTSYSLTRTRLSAPVKDGESFLVPYPTGHSATSVYVSNLSKITDESGNVSPAGEITVANTGSAVQITNNTGRTLAAGTEITASLANRAGNYLTSGEWVSISQIFRLGLVGTGTVTFDARDALGNVTESVSSYSVSGASFHVEFPYFGDDAVDVRATFDSTMTVEII